MGPSEGKDDADKLAALARQGATWLRSEGWPVWLEHGVDWHRRAFHEHLTHEDRICAADFRRLRVVTRQVYVFSHAAADGLPRAGEAVELGLSFLRTRARQADGGYAWRFDLDNNPIDLTRDLYDHAFVLLALSSAAVVLNPEPLRREALSLASYIETQFAHPRGGYLESVPPAYPRRQNPHMHLLEALLAAFDAFAETAFLDRAAKLVDLFYDRLFQEAEGALPEFFDETLAPERTGGRFLVEPGHHAEWIWLLDWYREASTRAGRGGEDPQRLEGAIRALGTFLWRHGVHARRNLLVDEVWSDGTPWSVGSRLWPQMERIKAEVRRPVDVAASTEGAFSSAYAYLEAGTPGLWRERMTPEGEFVDGPAPATSLYHITGAFMDLQRKADCGSGDPGAAKHQVHHPPQQ